MWPINADFINIRSTPLKIKTNEEHQYLINIINQKLEENKVSEYINRFCLYTGHIEKEVAPEVVLDILSDYDLFLSWNADALDVSISFSNNHIVAEHIYVAEIKNNKITIYNEIYIDVYYNEILELVTEGRLFESLMFSLNNLDIYSVVRNV